MTHTNESASLLDTEGASENVMADQAISESTVNDAADQSTGCAFGDIADEDTGVVYISGPEIERALNIARQLIEAGVPVFVAPMSKTAEFIDFDLPNAWQKTTPDLAVLSEWKPGDALCAVGGHTLDVLDMDPRNGGEESAKWMRSNGLWPTAYGSASTPSGGTHDYIAPLRIGKKGGNDKKLKPGIDLQGGREDGTGRGFVYISPTIRTSKATQQPVAYKWIEAPDLDRLTKDAETDDSGQKLRQWALDALDYDGTRKPKPGKKSGSGSASASTGGTPASADSVRARLTQLCDELAAAPDGEGNNTAARIAWMVGQWVGAGQLSEQEAIDALEAVVGSWGYQKRGDFERDCNTIRSQVRAGSQVPWALEDRRRSAAVPQKALNLPEEFWNARPVLAHIRQAAYSRGAVPDLVLCALLARLSSVVSHELRFETVLGEGSLNLFVAAVAKSSGGKSSGARVARALIKPPTYLGPDFRDGIGVGSGEGLAEAYMGTVNEPTGELDAKGKKKFEKVRKQVRHNVFMYMDEGQGLVKMADRAGATIGPALRSAWTGEAMGQANAKEETTRFIQENSYALGLLIGFQYSTVQPLFTEAAAGTPQRFLWCSTEDPGAPDLPPTWPGELAVELETSFMETVRPRTGIITFPESVNTEIWSERLRKMRGQDTARELDSHKSLMLCKLSALLAILDGRYTVSLEDWALAQSIWLTSCSVRDSAVAYGQREASETARARREAEVSLVVEKQEAVDAYVEAKADKDVTRVARRIADSVHDKGAQTRKELRDMLGGRNRPHLDDALAHAIGQGWVTDADGKWLPGGSRPV